MEPSPELTIEEAGQTWQALATFVEQFQTAWDENESVPSPLPFLPNGPAPLRRMVLIELVKIDLRYRWIHRQQPRVLEDYCDIIPELREHLSADLLVEEYLVRKKAGHTVSADEYVRRFPEQAALFRRLAGESAKKSSVALSTGQKTLKGIDPGQTLEDFELRHVLGQGSFAKVFLAWQKPLQRLVALKVTAHESAESQTLAQLEHPNIVRIYDQRVLADRGLMLLYMQFIPGGTLQDVVAHVKKTPPAQRSGRLFLEAIDKNLLAAGALPTSMSPTRQHLAELSWPDLVCWLGIHLARALTFAASRGVLHRDLKPANILLSAEGLPLLADFNISFSSKLDGANPAAFFGGSLAYMSPEQLDACNPASAAGPQDLDQRSDLFSLGVVLWELLCGARPFTEKVDAHWAQSLSKIAEQRRRPIADEARARLPENLPPGMEQVLLKCLAPDPNDRYASGLPLIREFALCREPRARRILTVEPGSWRSHARRFPTFWLLFLGLIPNGIAAIFNYWYNFTEIVLRHPELETPFFWAQLNINVTAFPAGLAWFFLRFQPIARFLVAPDRERTEYEQRDLERRLLDLGTMGAQVSLMCWLLAGLAYPITLRMLAGPLPWNVMIHFFASLALCGLIAAAYPFFIATCLALRIYFPAVVAPSTGTKGFAALRRKMSVYLWLGAAVPMMAIVAVALVGSGNRLALVLLGSAGLVGFGFLFVLYRMLYEDLQSLAYALRPPEEFLQATDISSNLSRL
jgi:serine/threonine protein kinase